MRTLRVAILALGLAAVAMTGCSKKKADTTPTEPAADTANPCAGAANPCAGAANPCAPADPCAGGEKK